MSNRTKILLLGALVALRGALAQPTVTPSGNPVITAGQPFNVSVQLGGSAAPIVTALQFTLNFPQPFGVPTATIGTSIATIKAMQCVSGNTTDLCVMAGVNKAIIPNGEVAKIVFQNPAPTGPGPFLLQLTNVIASDGNGNPVTITAGSLSVTTSIFGDINNDGKFDITDVLAAVLAKLTTGVCQFGGACTVMDLQKWINQAAGL